MPRSAAPDTPVRATRGKTVGKALFSSFLHDFAHRNEAQHKPLYTQAQFNRMVDSLKSEQEHRIYLRYVSLYTGILEEQTRAQGFFQQAQNGMLRLCIHLREVRRAEAAEALLETLPTPYTPLEYAARHDELLVRRRTQADSYAGVLLHAFHYYTGMFTAERPTPPAALAPSLEAYLAQHSPVAPDGEEAAYAWLAAEAPALFAALQGLLAEADITPGDDPYQAVYRWGDLADAGLWFYPQDIHPTAYDMSKETPAATVLSAEGEDILPPLRALFHGLSDLAGDPLLQAELDEARQMLLLPALRYILAYNEMLARVAAYLKLPALLILDIDLETLRAQIDTYNADVEATPDMIVGPLENRWQKMSYFDKFFRPVTIDDYTPAPDGIEAADALLRDEEQIKNGTVHVLMQALMGTQP